MYTISGDSSKTTMEIDMKKFNCKSSVGSGRITAAVALLLSTLLVAVAPAALAEEKAAAADSKLCREMSHK